LVFLSGCLAAAGPASAAEFAPAIAPSATVLSNESTFTRWAHPRAAVVVRSEPSPAARAAGSLHMLTEEGLPEVYLLLDQMTVAPGQEWVRLRLPGRPNGRTGWVPRADLGAFHLTAWALRVNLSTLTATLFLAGRPVWSAPVGVGAPSTPTPTGRFWIRELLSVAAGTIYGPYAFGTSDYSVLSEWPHGGVVGIHGTNEPALVPGHPSHGCIRMRNADIVYLARHLPLGAPVHIVG
jgi:hypothetical protein